MRRKKEYYIVLCHRGYLLVAKYIAAIQYMDMVKPVGLFLFRKRSTKRIAVIFVASIFNICLNLIYIYLSKNH